MKSPMTVSHGRPRGRFRRLGILALAALAVTLALLAGSGADRADAEVVLPEIDVTWSQLGPKSVRVEWPAFPNASDYDAFWKGHRAADAHYTKASNYHAPSDDQPGHADITGMLIDTVYTVRVRARHDTFIAESVFPVVLLSGDQPAIPGLSTTTAATSIKFNWPEVTGADGYFVSWISSGEGIRSAALPATARDHTIDGLTTGTEYAMQVAALSPQGVISNLSRTQVTPRPRAPRPPPPTGTAPAGAGAYQYLADDCVATFLAADGTFSGRWSDDPDCEAAYSSRNVSRFYYFTLPDGQSEVTFTLQGGGADAKMWLWPEWTNGHAAVGDAKDPMRARFLTPGVHYLEVDSGRNDGRGEFTITMDGIGAGASGLSCSDTFWNFTGSGSVEGRWDAGCATSHYATSHYHREYDLTLTQPEVVTIDVTSPTQTRACSCPAATRCGQWRGTTTTTAPTGARASAGPCRRARTTST